MTKNKKEKRAIRRNAEASGRSYQAQHQEERPAKERSEGQISDPITFLSAPWGLKINLYPVQKFIVKLYYGLKLDDERSSIVVTDRFREREIGRFTEAGYLAYLHREGRCNVSPEDILEDRARGRVRRHLVRRRLVLSAGRLGGSSTLSSIFAAYELYRLLAMGDPHAYFGLSQESPIQLLVVSTGKGQAGVLHNDTSSRITKSEYFRPFIVGNMVERFDFRTPAGLEEFGGSPTNDKARLRMSFKAAVAHGLQGPPTHTVILDGMAHFQRDGHLCDKEVYDQIAPSTLAFSPKDPNDGDVPIGGVESRIFCISSPLNKVGKFYDLFRLGMGPNNPGWDSILAIRVPTWEMNPAIPSQFLREKYNEDPEVFKREYGAEFGEVITSVGPSDEKATFKKTSAAAEVLSTRLDKAQRQVEDLSGGLGKGVSQGLKRVQDWVSDVFDWTDVFPETYQSVVYDTDQTLNPMMLTASGFQPYPGPPSIVELLPIDPRDPHGSHAILSALLALKGEPKALENEGLEKAKARITARDLEPRLVRVGDVGILSAPFVGVRVLKGASYGFLLTQPDMLEVYRLGPEMTAQDMLVRLNRTGEELQAQLDHDLSGKQDWHDEAIAAAEAKIRKRGGRAADLLKVIKSPPDRGALALLFNVEELNDGALPLFCTPNDEGYVLENGGFCRKKGTRLDVPLAPIPLGSNGIPAWGEITHQIVTAVEKLTGKPIEVASLEDIPEGRKALVKPGLFLVNLGESGTGHFIVNPEEYGFLLIRPDQIRLYQIPSKPKVCVDEPKGCGKTSATPDACTHPRHSGRGVMTMEGGHATLYPVLHCDCGWVNVPGSSLVDAPRLIDLITSLFEALGRGTPGSNDRIQKPQLFKVPEGIILADRYLQRGAVRFNGDTLGLPSDGYLENYCLYPDLDTIRRCYEKTADEVCKRAYALRDASDRVASHVKLGMHNVILKEAYESSEEDPDVLFNL